MSLPKPPSALRIVNRTGTPARLRFRYAGYLVWDTWAGEGSMLTVPALSDRELELTVSLRQARTGVVNTVSTRLRGHTARLVASIKLDHGAERFALEPEPCEQGGHLCLLNLTSSELHCTLHFLDSPFTLRLVVPPQGEKLLALDGADVTATVDGITLPAVPIRTWAGDIVIGMAWIDDKQYAQITTVAPDGHVSPTPGPLY